MENLDLACASLGQQLATLDGVEDRLLTDALSVLEEQGVYACFLFLSDRGGAGGRRVREKCAEFLQRVPAGAALLGKGELFSALQALAEGPENLDKLLFVRDLLRQALVYGRYHAKSAEAGRR